MGKCLVLFVEGDTEVEFYKRLIAFARLKRDNQQLDTSVECRNVGGVGGFKGIALRKFVKEIKPKYEAGCEFTVVLCSDTDVFELSSKPPVNWSDIKKELKRAGAKNVIMVKAVKSIEDWFLYDLENILAFLGLKKDTKISGGNGYEKLKALYRKANKIYFKGMKSNGMISKLDIQTISVAVRTQLEPLYKALGVDL